jgi:hypothetical protein
MGFQHDPAKRRFTMVIGGGILGTILMVLLIVYLWRRV